VFLVSAHHDVVADAHFCQGRELWRECLLSAEDDSGARSEARRLSTCVSCQAWVSDTLALESRRWQAQIFTGLARSGSGGRLPIRAIFVGRTTHAPCSRDVGEGCGHARGVLMCVPCLCSRGDDQTQLSTALCRRRPGSVAQAVGVWTQQVHVHEQGLTLNVKLTKQIRGAGADSGTHIRRRRSRCS